MQLLEIQKLQFSDRQAAEQRLLEFLQLHEDPDICAIELRPRPESLNSMNGFVTYTNNERYFFKTHVEENEQVSEYYKASLLSEAAYPVLAGKQISHRPGKQIVLYEIINLPTLFDLLKKDEDAELGGLQRSEQASLLLSAQEKLEREVFQAYKRSLASTSASEFSQAPIHQLFHHRLAKSGRLGLFYLNKTIKLGGQELSFADLSSKNWRINGAVYKYSLAEIIENCRDMLDPERKDSVAAITGHGDAHNGNVFADLDQGRLILFDPAFAGRHHPLLDLCKPLFHNIFARWMYFPQQVESEFQLEFKIGSCSIEIEHNFQVSKLRLEHLNLKVENLLMPTLALLSERALLDPDWQDYLRSALFCCPFLTVNLFSPYRKDGSLSERYSEAIKLLGLSQAVELAFPAEKGQTQMSLLLEELFSRSGGL